MNSLKLFSFSDSMKMMPLLAVFAVFVTNCTAFESDTKSSLAATNSALKCANPDSTERIATRTSIKRMSLFQFKNTYKDLFSRYLNDSEVNALISSVDFNAVPKDTDEKMTVFDQSVSVSHIEAYMDVSKEAKNHIFSDMSLKNKIFGDCHTDVGDESCLRDFIAKFGKLAHRRPLTQTQIDNYVDVFNNDTSLGYENVLMVMLNSPSFVYKLELGTNDLTYGYSQLSQYELASKLSYLYLRSMPDDVLFNKAKNQELKDKKSIEVEIERLMSLPQSRQRLTKAFAEQWLGLKKTPEIVDNSPAMDAILQTLSSDTSKAEIRDSIIQEVYDYLDYHIWENRSGIKEILTSNVVFPRTDVLAEIYGTPVWSGSYNNLVKAPKNERAGVLTQAHFLFTGISSTRPIMRGVHFYEKFYCGSLPAPADNSTPEGVVVEDDFTERQKVTAITEHPESSCVGCHKPIINPIGFSFENFDSLGRFRAEESVYAGDFSESKGEVIAQKPVNSETNFQLKGMSKEIHVTDSVDFVKKTVQSDQVEACFAKTVWKFGVAERLSDEESACASLGLLKADRLGRDASVYEMFKNIGLQPEFNSKRIY